MTDHQTQIMNEEEEEINHVYRRWVWTSQDIVSLHWDKFQSWATLHAADLDHAADRNYQQLICHSLSNLLWTRQDHIAFVFSKREIISSINENCIQVYKELSWWERLVNIFFHITLLSRSDLTCWLMIITETSSIFLMYWMNHAYYSVLI